MTVHHDERLLLTAADLLTGAEELARMRKHGTPAMLVDAGCEPPEIVLARLWATIRHTDLPGGFGPLWGAAVALWRQGKAATLEHASGMVTEQDGAVAASALRYCRAHGMGIPYMAPVAAERILRHAMAVSNRRDALDAAAKAHDGARRALDGVV